MVPLVNWFDDQRDYRALVIACLKNPDEHTPRMVLADWLEDHDLPTEAAAVLRGQGFYETDHSYRMFWYGSNESGRQVGGSFLIALSPVVIRLKIQCEGRLSDESTGLLVGRLVTVERPPGSDPGVCGWTSRLRRHDGHWLCPRCRDLLDAFHRMVR